MTQRRSWLLAIAAGGVALTADVRAQTGSSRRLCWLGATSRNEPYAQAMVQRLAELGYTEGRNLQLDYRQVVGRAEAFRAAAIDLSRQPCDLFFAPGTPLALRAVLDATQDVPVVTVANDFDPVEHGFAASLARPGGRVTGVSQLVAELPAKRLEVARTLLPRATRIGMLSDDVTEPQWRVSSNVAARLGLTLVTERLGKPPFALDSAIARLAAAGCELLMPLSSGLLAARRQEIVALAQRHRLPTLCSNVVWVETGALMSYGPNFSASYRRAADISARLLGGAKAADTPIEQPQVLELVINLAAAKTFGINIPQALRLRADRLIE